MPALLSSFCRAPALALVCSVAGQSGGIASDDGYHMPEIGGATAQPNAQAYSALRPGQMQYVPASSDAADANAALPWLWKDTRREAAGQV